MENKRIYRKKKQPSNLNFAPKKLKLLVSIVERSKCEFYLDVLEGYEINLQTVIYGAGTAPKEISSLLGFPGQNKAIILSIVQEMKIKDILNTYEDKYFKLRNGRGIAFSISLTSVIGKMTYEFLANMKEG